jgi:chemotaxis protein MotB
MRGSGKRGDKGAVVIRREEVIEEAGHGGSWKIAYADFVTAMMAFFLLMWLIGATTDDQRRGIADYFAPSNVFSKSTSGSGKPFGGHTPFDPGSLVSDRGAQAVRLGSANATMDTDDPDTERYHSDAAEPDTPPVSTSADQDPVIGPAKTAQQGQTDVKPSAAQPAADAAAAQAALLANAAVAPAAAKPDVKSADDAALRAELERREKEAFAKAAEQIREAVRNDPALANLARQLAIDLTPEGLRIQLLDEDQQPMFATGSWEMNERAKLLLQKVAPVLSKLPENISIAGHTDAAPYKGDGMSNWELSSLRANATRRLLVEGGLEEQRFRSVTGNADRDPLIPADPLAAANRRIAILVLRQYPAATP